jgi:hypothetical protein
MPGNVKGALLVHFSRYVTENGGEARYRALVDKLAPEQQRVVQSLVLPASWYPVEAYNQLIAAFLHEHPGSIQEFGKLVRQVAEWDFSTTYKLLMRFSSPELLLGRSGSLWSRYFDTGKVEIVEKHPHHWTILLRAPTTPEAAPSEATCAIAVPVWWTYALSLGGVTARIEHHPCRFDARGGVCTYDVSW